MVISIDNNKLSIPLLPACEGNLSEAEQIEFGAYLISHLKIHCENCGVEQTPQWRKGWFEKKINRPVNLCNACGIRYHKNQFCPYCKYVYGKETDNIPNTWLICVECGRWTHISCESKFGKLTKEQIESQLHTCIECKNNQTKNVFPNQ